MFVRFADGLAGTWSFSTLGLDMSNMKVETIRAPKNGTGISVKSIQNEDLLLDSSMVRYKIDPKYAAMIDHAIAELHLPLEEAREAARLSEVTRDPRWNEVGDEDDLFE
jgi:hypothetical protein